MFSHWMLFEGYGPLKPIVENAGFAISAATVLTVGWWPRRGSAWLPGDYDVPKVYSRTASLIVAVVLSVLYVVYWQRAENLPLMIIVFVCLSAAIVGLVLTRSITKKYGFIVERRGIFGRRRASVVLGGTVLSDESKEALAREKVPKHVLVEWAHVNENPQYMETVFTKESIALVQNRACIAFLMFQAFGSLSLGIIGLLLSSASSH